MDYNSLGLNFIENFITAEEEIEILKNIPKGTVKKTPNRNNVKRYGSNKPYNHNMISATLPDFLDKLCEKLFKSGLVEVKPNSATINEYYPGQKIAAHIDSVSSGPVISVLSLGSTAEMKLSLGRDSFTLVLPPRSLVQMKDDIRNTWSHSVDKIENLRYSIVFRHGTDIDGLVKKTNKKTG